MQKGPSPRAATRINLHLQTDASWSQCEAAMQGTAAKRIAVIDSRNSSAWFPTNQSELEAAVREATRATGDWPYIRGVSY